MTFATLFRRLLAVSTTTLFLLAICPRSLAQGPIPEAPAPRAAAAQPAASFLFAPTSEVGEHSFWDRQNKVLLVSLVAANTADFAVTRSNLQNGGQELNPVVRIFGRSSAGLAVNFAGETAGVVGLSYLFHKTGHHRMERLVSYINIGASAGAVGYGLAHR